MNRSLRNLVLAVLLVRLASAAFAADERHPLTKALDYDTNLLLVLDLRLDSRQLAALSAATNAAVKIAAAQPQSGAGQALVQQEFRALAEGRPLTEQQQAALAQLRAAERQQRGRLYASVDAQIKRLRRALSPEQASMVDWTAPPEVPAVPNETAALEELRALAAKLDSARGFLDRMRYIIPTQYIQTRIARTDEFIGEYYEPGTQAFVAARDWTMKLVDDARMVNEDQWPQQAPAFASELLQRMGALNGTEMAPANNQARYNWWDVYDLLTDPQSPYMLQAMSGAVAPANGNNEGNNADNGDDE
ncbi:MAG: hypothetical protein ACM3VW_08780 [Bacteroidota bacterium]